MDLSKNNFNGTVHYGLFGKSHQLETVNIQDNLLYGKLPRTMGSLKNLRELAISNNMFSGTLPAMNHVKRLESVSMRGNILSGELSLNLKHWKNITYLDVYDNLFEDVMRDLKLGKLHKLESLDLGRNYFIGSISSNMGLLLEMIDFSENDLSGNIPYQISNMSNLKELRLDGNMISGDIPPGFKHLYNLEFLILTDNFFDQEMHSDDDLGTEWKSIVEIKLDGNSIHGTIPNSFCRLKNEMKLQVLVADCDIIVCDCCTYCGAR
uniref:Uncharacterized protein n=1 Tax=Proboscia inermis TaxID=420281 RepID=A0A7S0BYY8_9STRA|mmetsp:Transcript_17493/g.17706  ORF Transcript_17493/g.17706 Transcript_17493/m.17706 type:complete len:265 (+) Transcript_17493:203-997(+)